MSFRMPTFDQEGSREEPTPYQFGDAVKYCFDLVDSILMSRMLRRDPIDVLYRASLRILEANAMGVDAATSDALGTMLEVRTAIFEERTRLAFQRVMMANS